MKLPSPQKVFGQLKCLLNFTVFSIDQLDLGMKFCRTVLRDTGQMEILVVFFCIKGTTKLHRFQTVFLALLYICAGSLIDRHTKYRRMFRIIVSAIYRPFSTCAIDQQFVLIHPNSLIRSSHFDISTLCFQSDGFQLCILPD